MPSLHEMRNVDLAATPRANVVVRCTQRSVRREVAVIGLSVQIGEAPDLDDFWARLLAGEEGFAPLSADRRADVDAYLASRGVTLPITEERYIGGTRLPRICDFDHRFFGMSAIEARLTDPHQRLFLQAAWSALEDAGHLGEDLRGTAVGIYAGISADFGIDYRSLIDGVAPDAPEASVAGNIRSIIASRLAYLLDLRGPSMLIDTACSSGLVATMAAVRALQEGECEMALVGGVKCDILPVAAGAEGIGIRDLMETVAADHSTRTFDRRSDGTSAAEGVVVLVLKPLDTALRDGDNIRAILCGGAVNQDGASNGITAPNADAQGHLIADALADAGVSAEQISYIEAHGTATRLGDPVEVGGIQRAFSQTTQRRQFCAIGTVKTNIGHMDNVSGLAGLAKVIAALEHRVLPVSLHFEEPNPNIVFPTGPLYVNDRVTPWGEAPGEVLHAGVSSFGLSGTNCHVIVRSADPRPERAAAVGPFLLPLSAKRPQALVLLAERYLKRLKTADLEPADIAFTAATGRLHHRPHRSAIVFSDVAELREGLRALIDDVEHPDVFTAGSATTDGCAGRDGEADGATREAEAVCAAGRDRDALRALAGLYVRGADVPWHDLFGSGHRRVSLPTYPFEEIRCWVEAAPQASGINTSVQVIASQEVDLGIARLSPRTHWELSEHRIHGVSVLPGTGLVELILSVLRGAGHDLPVTLEGLIFLTPLAVLDDEVRDVHVLFTGEGEARQVTVSSRAPHGEWIEHATATLITTTDGAPGRVDVANEKVPLTRRLSAQLEVDEAKGLVLSDRWTGSYVDGWADEELDNLFLEFALPEHRMAEAAMYVVHPALLDAVINAPSNLYDSNTLYLPLSYGRLTVHAPLSGRVMARFVCRPESIDGQIAAFDVTIMDTDGTVLLTAESYCLKAESGRALLSDDGYGYVQVFHALPQVAEAPVGTGPVLLWGFSPDETDALVHELGTLGYTPVLAGQETGLPPVGMAFVTGLLGTDRADTDPRPLLADTQAFLRTMVDQEWTFEHGLLAVTRHALQVTGEETVVRPDQAAALGLLRVAALEFRSMSLRCLDTDGALGARGLLAEAFQTAPQPWVVARDDQRLAPGLGRQQIRRDERAGAPTTGVVLITGGTGDLGRVVARHLKGQGLRVVLLGSPGRDVPDAEAELTLGQEGFDVRRVDLTDPSAVTGLVTDLRERHGRIGGILHLAGRPGRGYLYDKESETFADVFDAKAVGALNLAAATVEDDLDFFLFFSSISGLLVNPGQGDYTAANLFLDSLAQQGRLAGRRFLSVQWPAWRETGIARRLGAVDEEEELQPIDTAEALALLDALLGAADLPAALSPARRRIAPTAAAHAVPALGSSSGREVRLFGGREGDTLEQAVAEVWAETLELDELDAQDDFSSLGGNSLLTSHLLKAFEQRFPGQIDITDLFRYTTVAAQADMLRTRRSAAAGDETAEDAQDDDLDRLLDALEQGHITVEQSTRLL